jgi:nicotinate-nucleotide adenylyltransferase
MQQGVAERIGILGGSFDPVHVGHLMLACSLAEAHTLDSVLFIPTNKNPLKNRVLADAHHRVAMLTFALKGTDFSIYMGELERKPPSYMIDTVRGLMATRPASYHLLIGSDIVEELTKWKSYEELLALAPPLVALRGRERFEDLLGRLPLPKTAFELLEKGVTETPLFDISSTYVRERLEKGLYCGHLLHADVYDYIKRNRLYGIAHAE